MHSHQTQPHYAPSSVGALMDPGFLRNAVIDANGDRRPENASPVTLSQCWRVATHVVADVFRRH
jgi:hypothetical protein